MKQRASWQRFLMIVGIASTLFLCLPGSQALAETIRVIRVEGAERIDPATVMTYVDVQAGDPFDGERMNRALKSLFATGLFADVSLYQEGRDLIISIVENPIINEITFEGNDKIKSENLLSEIQLRPRTVLTRTKVQTDVERLQELYRLSGRFSVSIDPKIIKLDQNRVNLVFEISEGPKTLISRIGFIGNKRYDDGKLQRVVRSKEDRWWRIWSGDDKYDPDRMAYDRELLRKFYLEHGYADFYVENAVAELSPDRRYFYITFTLNEGDRYRVGNVHVQSTMPEVNTGPLKEELTFKPGSWYKASELEKTVEQLSEALTNAGHPFIDVVPTVERRRDQRAIDITFTVNEGRKVFVDNINVSGNVRTLDEVVRREVTLVEGDPFNNARLRKSEQRIRDLGFFERVEVKAVPGATADKANIDITISEKSTGELSIGGGYSTVDGILGDFRIRERNFLGKGQDLSLSTTLSTRRTEFDLSFTEPYFLKRDLSAGFDLYHITRDFQEESSYDSKRSGGGIRLGYPLADKWRQNLGYRFETTEITNVDPAASIFIQQQQGSRTTSALNQKITYDTTDSRLEPTEGLLARLETEIAGLGGDAAYIQARGGGTYYYPIVDKWIFSLLGEAGYIHGLGGVEVKINERFYIGGATLRGFQRSGIGPRDTATNDALGGNRFWRGSAEIDFPSGLPEDLGVRLHVFTDFGSLASVDDDGPTVFDKASVRATAGAGLSWRSPLGPVRVNFATPYLQEDEDETEFFRFNFGTRF